ncbi:hypothetical protein HUJ04_012423 [Dendroctonus ponderosae]|nr:hypothetical protein HUJ04_012423 [Dendroctonus ponderosae]
MNAFYVTLSIPLLLVLAGFNHAHGLTTFGKSTPNNQPPSMRDFYHSTSKLFDAPYILQRKIKSVPL